MSLHSHITFVFKNNFFWLSYGSRNFGTQPHIYRRIVVTETFDCFQCTSSVKRTHRYKFPGKNIFKIVKFGLFFAKFTFFIWRKMAFNSLRMKVSQYYKYGIQFELMKCQENTLLHIYAQKYFKKSYK